jgi:lysophospholipase L1-like esterase
MENDDTNQPQGLLEGDEHARVVSLVGEDDGGVVAPGTFRKIGTAIATLAAAILATYYTPALQWARPWVPGEPVPFWNIVGREILGEGEVAAEVEEREEATEVLAQHVLAKDDAGLAPIEDKAIVAPPATDVLPPYKPHPDDAAVPTQVIEMPNDGALDRFLGRLARSDAGYAGAVTRVVHWGDSVVAADHITSAVRAQMQMRFGDAGHGFHLLAKPNASYVHKAIEFRGGDDWSRCYIINKCKSDGRYGLGGTTVWSAGGADSKFRTSDSTPNGRKASRIELWYMKDPKGGNVTVTVDDEPPVVVSTAGDAVGDGWHQIDVADGPHEFKVRASGGGRARLYGVVIERDVPGVVWDGMAQLGAFTSRMLYFDPDHIRDQIEHRDAALLVFMFGGNDLLLPSHRLDEYEETFRSMLKRFRAQADPPDCLVMSPVDHGIRESQRVVSNPMVAKITAVQREVAFEQGCAFFDTQAAMGGDGSVARWRRSNPPRISGDLAHLTDAGQKVLGHMLYVAILQRYVEFRTKKG